MLTMSVFAELSLINDTKNCLQANTGASTIHTTQSNGNAGKEGVKCKH